MSIAAVTEVDAIRIQTVRFGGDDAALLRMVRSVAADSCQSKSGIPPPRVTLALGDCGDSSGPETTLRVETVEECREVLAAVGGDFAYEAFGANLGHGGGQNRLAKGLREIAVGGGSAGLAGGGEGGAGRPGGGRGGADEVPEVIVLLNPDTYLVPGCLEALLAAVTTAGVGIAEARQIPLEHPKSFDPATGDTPWASGCAMAVRTELFESLGGFEEAFFLQGDDVDLSWRVRMGGSAVRHIPQAVAFHDKRPGPSGFPEPDEIEAYHGVLARLLLAHRAERPDVIERWLDWADSEGTPVQKEAAADFRRRSDSGSLPATYRDALGVTADAVAAVADFVEGEYAPRRF